MVSGGHTLLCVVHADCRYELLGETRDDAVGEAFDKVAKLLGLGYPGGPVIDRLSTEAQGPRLALPKTHTKGTYDFSFSVLKTAVYHRVQDLVDQRPRREPLETGAAAADGGGAGLDAATVANVAASFQEAAVDLLIQKTLRACQRTGMSQIVVGGGVASNRRLRARFAEEASAKKLRVVFPPPKLCVDNGAMVAGIGFPLLQRGRVAPLSLGIDSNLCLS